MPVEVILLSNTCIYLRMKRFVFLFLLWLQTPFLLLADDILATKVEKLSSGGSEWKRVLYFVIIILVQAGLIWLTEYLYKWVRKKIVEVKETKLKSVNIQGYEVLDKDKQVKVLLFFTKVAKWFLIAIQLIIIIPALFSVFPQTKELASILFSYIWKPIKLIGNEVLNYLPNLFTIVVIVFIIRYLIRLIKYMSDQITEGKIKIAGFYQDWAAPTFHIVRFLLYAFMIAMIYPYLPGSKSGVFQGVSVFVGLIISLGSSTVIGNVIAGFVITYMRPFKIGDRIQLNETTGNVIEKTALVTRIRTPKNELVTIPNSFIMSSHTTNYSESARDLGLIIHSEVTIGYDTNWRKIHQLLIDSAKATPGVSADPEPFVLETSLSDFYPVYQINAYIKEADKLPRIYSALFQNIQDKFAEAGVEIMSPHYTAFRNGNESTIPKPDKT